jgi:hypothetical protein
MHPLAVKKMELDKQLIKLNSFVIKKVVSSSTNSGNQMKPKTLGATNKLAKMKIFILDSFLVKFTGLRLKLHLMVPLWANSLIHLA